MTQTKTEMKGLFMMNAKYMNMAVMLLAFGLIGGCKEKPQENTQSQSAAGARPASGEKTDFAAIGGEVLKMEGIGPLKLGLSADETVKFLGNPETKSEAIVWPADGLEHQEWIYKQQGIKLDMITDGGKQEVGKITASAPCEFKTKRGVGIGTGAQAVMDAYKAEIDPAAGASPEAIYIGSEYGGIVFSMQDGRVSSIFFGASAE